MPGHAKATATRLDKARFAERLSRVMDEQGLSLAETARRVRAHLPDGQHFTDANLTHYRKGRSAPRPIYLEALSLALGVDKARLTAIEHPEPPARPAPAAERVSPLPLASAAPILIDATASPAIAREAPNIAQRGHVLLEDLGEVVHLRIDETLPWPIALKVLEALRGPPTL